MGIQEIKEFFGTSLGAWIIAIGVMALAFVLRPVFLFVVDNYFSKFTKRTKSDVDDELLRRAKMPFGTFILIWGMYAAVYFLKLPSEPYDWRNLIYNLLDTVLILILLILVLRVIDLASHLIRERYKHEKEVHIDQILPFFRDIARILAVVGALVWMVYAWGKDPSVMLAGLGIGGLAIGFAAKDTVANIFGSITIFTDKPFDVGDWVIIGDDEGIVEEIGFRTTKIRTFEKTLITVPNSIISNTSVDNFSRRPGRRVKQRIGILYETPVDKIEKAIEGIRNILDGHDEVLGSPMLVFFEEFGDSALVIFIYYFTKTTVWAEYMQVKQDMNLAIMRLFESLGIEFAYPTHTLWHKNDFGFGAGLPKLSDGDIDTQLP